MAKGSKTVKVIVSQKEARQFLSEERTGSYTELKVFKKLQEAVRKTFTDYAKFLKEEDAVRQVMNSVHESSELKAISFQLREQRNLIDKQYDEINSKEAAEVEKLINAKLDEAGITSYRAKGWGWQRVDIKLKPCKETPNRALLAAKELITPMPSDEQGLDDIQVK